MIQSSVRVKIKEYVHAWFELLFFSLLVIFNFFSQINHFYYFTSLHGLQDVENHCAHLRDIELKTARKKSISPLSPCIIYSLYNWILEHEITKQKQKQAQKDMNEMEWHKMDYLIFSEMRMRKRHLFCVSSHPSVPYRSQTLTLPWIKY